MAEYQIQITIPMNLQPLERGERFDLPLCDLFDEIGGELVGGGSMCINGVITSCDVEVTVSDLDLAIPRIIAVLESGGACSGTTLVLVGSEPKELYRIE